MGLAGARAFAGSGAAVVLVDRDEDAVREAAEEIGVACDVTDERQVEAAVRRAVTEFGRLDMAFGNAGIQVPPSDAADESADSFDRVNGVNLRGVWAATKHELRQIREQGSGAIVNCSSLGGLVGLPERAAHHASKHGVIGLTRALRPVTGVGAGASGSCTTPVWRASPPDEPSGKQGDLTLLG
ncbi:SDR family oxidoreductase [Streptomyces roseirectus]|uniref:SDR family oxidoreductase n=1 Tax=Streptomyces roseirectus TaxID=2768066 RepID=A0A7H0IPQ1_9ACTN|nr:SDR family oxidoreductase [Streptomyces roseirectus]